MIWEQKSPSRSLDYEPHEDPELIDIGQIDFNKLREKFDTGKQRTEAEQLRALLSQKLAQMVARNLARYESEVSVTAQVMERLLFSGE